MASQVGLLTMAVQGSEHCAWLNWLYPGSAPNMLRTLEGSVSLALSFLICEMDLNRPASLRHEV